MQPHFLRKDIWFRAFLKILKDELKKADRDITVGKWSSSISAKTDYVCTGDNMDPTN
jgi:hypothetical protein